MSDQIEAKTEETEKPKTDEELKALAFDIFQGKVFTDRHLADVRDISVVFMPLSFLSEAQIEQLKADDPGLIYEYMEKAGPRAINDMPCFFSMNLLSQDDAKKVMEMCKELTAMKDQVGVGGGQQ